MTGKTGLLLTASLQIHKNSQHQAHLLVGEKLLSFERRRHDEGRWKGPKVEERRKERSERQPLKEEKGNIWMIIKQEEKNGRDKREIWKDAVEEQMADINLVEKGVGGN